MRTCRPLLLLAVTALLASAEGPRDSVRLLAIGNSFSNNILNQLPALAQGGGKTLIYEHCMFGGARLEQHWARVEAAERDPTDAKHLYQGKQGKWTLRDALVGQPWDVVTLQQYSFISHDPATYRPYADKLVALIRERAPQARIVMHQTWAYRSDDPRFVTIAKAQETEGNQAEAAGTKGTPVDMRTSTDMHRMVAAAYRSVAAELGLGLFPVGDAFAKVEADPVWGFKADLNWNPKLAVSPALPEQAGSLHGGWHWRSKNGQPVLDKDGKPVLGYDGHHANKSGEYLGACVWYEMLFRTSAVGNPYRPTGMSEQQARFLQETAHQVVEAEQTPR
jgi:hypothetical protein